MNFTFFPNRTSADLQVHAHKHSHHFYYRIFTYKRYCDISFEVGFPAKIFAFFREISLQSVSRKQIRNFRKIKMRKFHEKMQIFHEKMQKISRNMRKFQEQMEIMQKNANFAKIQNLKKSIFNV